MSDQKRSSGESFAGNVMKYSVATYLGFAITGLALIVKGLLPAEVLGAPVTFMTYTATIMNIGILGLDQALLRFYHEPPAGAEPRQLFAACTRISAAFMMLLGVAGSVFFAQPLAAAFGLGSAGPGIVPLLFLNAALYMLVRYLNVLLRLENDLRAYTAETLWMQGCYNLFYLLPGFFTSNVFVLAVAAILSFGVVAIAFGYKYRAAVFAPLPGAQLGGIARQTVPSHRMLNTTASISSGKMARQPRLSGKMTKTMSSNMTSTQKKPKISKFSTSCTRQMRSCSSR